ncbi:unnamed protein product, partial [Trichobilharzia regenti]
MEAIRITNQSQTEPIQRMQQETSSPPTYNDKSDKSNQQSSCDPDD